ncbi:MAG: TfpX/TfpZ family type IV pilin accessory protein [Burkholderiaceae bacterium]
MLPRVRASLVHLGISALIAAALIAIVFWLWYPPPLDEAAGVLHVFLMLIGVDVTIGPFITLIIFNPKKKSLKFDLAVIALLQLGALVYGMHAVFAARPAFVVFNVDRFDLVQENQLSLESQKRSGEASFRESPIGGPRWVGAELPIDKEARNKILFQAALGNYDLPQLPEYYVPLSSVREAMKQRLQPLDLLAQFNSKADLAPLAPYLSDANNYGFLPMRGRARDLTVIVVRKTGEIVKTLGLQPWKS